MMNKSRSGAVMAVVGLVFFGTCSTLMSKVEFQVDGVGLDGQRKYFRKPLFGCFVMFLGMAACQPLQLWLTLWSQRQLWRRRQHRGHMPRLDGVVEDDEWSVRSSAGSTAPPCSLPETRSAEQMTESTMTEVPVEVNCGIKHNRQDRRPDDALTDPLLSSSASNREDGSDTRKTQEEDMYKHGVNADRHLLSGEPKLLVSWRKYGLLCIPTLFDMTATILMFIGLLNITVSCYQMMRAAELVFTAIFSVIFLRKVLNWMHLSGIALAMIGITCVGASNLLGKSPEGSTGTPTQQLIGIFLVIISQSVQAAQLTFEDHFMSNLDIPPMLVVGMEGVYGSLICIFVVLPIAYVVPGNDAGSFENSMDSLHMIGSSHAVTTALVIAAMCAILYNLAGMQVTSHLGAVFRALVETTRTLFAWLVDLLVWYILPKLGEGITGENWHRYSWLQAVGFVILVIGTLAYSRGDELLAESAPLTIAPRIVKQDPESRRQEPTGLSVTSTSRPIPETIVTLGEGDAITVHPRSWRHAPTTTYSPYGTATSASSTPFGSPSPGPGSLLSITRIGTYYNVITGSGTRSPVVAPRR